MDKLFAIKYLEENSIKDFIETLISNGEKTLAFDIIENCWGFNSDSIIEYIEMNWEF